MSDTELEFEKVYDSYHDRISRYLAGLVGEGDAEDLTQEVFAKVSQALSTFRGQSQLSTWMYRIATNAAIDKMRTASFQQAGREDLLGDADEAGDADPSMMQDVLLPDQQLMRKEMYDCFWEFVKKLPTNYRATVVLSEVEGFANKEIAEILGLSLETVKMRLHRGRNLLFQQLKAHCKAEDWLWGN